MRKKGSNLKNVFFSFLIFLALLSASFVSCDNSVNEGSESTQESKKGRVTFTVVQPKGKNTRTVLPDSDINKLTDVCLTGYSDTGYTYNETFDSVSALQSNYQEYEEGYWTFNLSAKLYGVVFNSASQSSNITINSSSNISFTLATTKTTGVLDFKLLLTGSVDKVQYVITKLSDGSAVETGPLTVTNYPSKFVALNKEYSANTYRIQITFYKNYSDATGTHEEVINTYSEIINIRGGFTSSAERSVNLNELYTITYSYDESSCTLAGGDSLPENYSIYSTPVTLGELEKNGYDFQGWYTGTGGTGTKIESIPDLNPATRTLYAHFTAHEYTITYGAMTDAGYVVGESNPATYTIEDAFTYAEPVKEHYTFKGWYTLNNGLGDKKEGITAGQTGDVTLYAYWQPNPTITITPGFPESYKCYYTMVEKSAGKEIIIHVDNAATDTPATLETKQVSLYVSGTKVKDYDTLTFTYPKYLPAPDNYSFYVTFTIKKDATTSYSYDYYAERAWLGSKAPGDTLEVGDVVFTDGSAEPYSSTLTAYQITNAAAIIFYDGTSNVSPATGIGSKTLGIGLLTVKEQLMFNDYPSSPRVNAYEKILATDENDGSKTLSLVKAYGDYSESKYPGFYWAEHYETIIEGEPGGWYVPSYNELKELLSRKTLLQSVYSVLGITTTPYTAAEAATGGLISSTQVENSEQHFYAYNGSYWAGYQKGGRQNLFVVKVFD